MALVAEQYDTPAVSSSAPTTASLGEAAKQATKALKCVAFTTKQVSQMLSRKYERILKRIGSISEEVESLKADVMENITHQRERRLQLMEIEEDIEHAQLLGNSAFVESLYNELHVMKEETKHEESLYRALCKTVRSRKDTKKQFMHERLRVEDEIRTFTQKQKLIQTLLTTCSQQTSSGDNTQGSSASQSDCGASVLKDSDDEVDENDSQDGGSANSSSTGSFAENPLLDSPPLKTMDPTARKEKLLAKAVSLLEGSASPKLKLRVRSWSSDCVQPLPRDSVQNRPRHSLSVHFASPVLTVSTIATNDEELDKELESLDLAHYLASIDEAASSAAQPSLINEEIASVKEEETKEETVDAMPTEQITEPPLEQPQPEAAVVAPVNAAESTVEETPVTVEAASATTGPVKTVPAAISTLLREAATPAPTSATAGATLAA